VNILLVFPDQELAQAQVIETNVWKTLGCVNSTVIDLVKNERDAYNLFRSKEYNLVIVALNIPKTSKAPLNTEEEAGLAFLKKLRDDGFRKPSIVIADHMTTETLSRIRDLELSEPLLRGKEDWEVSLNLRVRQQLDLSVVTQKKKTCWIDIRLDLEKRTGDYEIRGNFLNGVRGVLEQLHFGRLGKLVLHSKIVGSLRFPDWIALFQNIGEELLEQIFRSNYSFKYKFDQAVDALGSDENLKIRFVITSSFHPVAFEALVDDDSMHWMLRSPVYRKIDASTELGLFEDENELAELPVKRCLIIVADTEGLVPKILPGVNGRILRPLRHVDSEGADLEQYLTNRGVIVRRLGGSSQDSASKRNVIDALKDGPWDTVHFAGHSFWDEEKSGKAVIFLPGETQPQILEVEPLAVLLRAARTRFVYLSSCSSSGCGVELARKQIPAILGHRWVVDDELAAEHARLFYSNRFEYPESLEKAFLYTRQAMYDKHRENQIWASSVLIKQTDFD